MSILNKRLRIKKTGQSTQTALIYSTNTECPEPNLKVNVDDQNGFVKLGDVSSAIATRGRAHVDSANQDYAILEQALTPDFPKEWGAFQDIKFTLTRNEDRTTYGYAWCLHFANGELPVFVGYNSTTATFNPDYFDDNVYSAYNSASWISSLNKWIPTVAADESELMTWTTAQGTNADAISYISAAMLDWPTNGGSNPSVFTSDFTYTATSQVLTIYKNGNEFISYNLRENFDE